MRLKSIRLAGFKSFVDPTTVNLPSNMTAVVGPNGCGKSNIIDAVRWVLGESSAKNLRGEAMTDVIFNGSNTRKPVSQASIELVFDNSAATLLGEYASYAEISVRRTVTRAAQSTYFLNGTKCRRRDITDLFLGTGLGPRSYAIIEQGTISRLIEARPDDLRMFIEEAAGISKYKERRRETETRMRRAQDNLARLSDLRDELGRQLERLQRQAHAAERYQGYQAQVRELSTQLLAMRWQGLQEQMTQLQETLSTRETALQAQLQGYYQAEAQSETLRAQHHERQERFNAVQARFYALGADIARTEQSIQHARQRLRQLQDEVQDAERQQQETRASVEQDCLALEELAEQELQLTEALAQATEQVELAQTEWLAAGQAVDAWQAQWQQLLQQTARPREQRQLERLRHTQLQASLVQHQQRLTALRAEREQLTDNLTQAELEEYALDYAEQQEQLALVSAQQQENEHQQHACQQRLQELQQAVQQCMAALQRCQGQMSALSALQEDALTPAETVQQWLQAQQLQQAPRLADGLRVAPGWEVAVETVLGGDLQALCLETWPSDFSALSQGHLRLAKTSPLTTQATTDGRLISKVLAAQVDLSPWLAAVRCADDLAAARCMLGSLAAGESVVTPEGYWLSPHFFRVQRGAHNEQGVLQRAQMLDALAAEEQPLIAELDELTAQREAAEEQRQHLHALGAELRTRVQQLTAQVSALHSQCAAQQARHEQFVSRLQHVEQQIQTLDEQHALDHEQLAETALLVEQAEQAVASAEAASSHLQGQQADLRQRHEQAQALAQQRQQQRQQLELQQRTVVTQKNALEQALQRLQQLAERHNSRHQQLRLDLAEGESPLALLLATLEEQLQQRCVVDDELQAERVALDELDQQLRQQEQARHATQQAAETIRSDLEQLRLNQHTLAVQQGSLEEQLAAQGVVLAEVLMGLPATAEPPAWQQQLDALSLQIQRLGAINLAAIEEYRQQAERKEFLDAQNEDLETALATLASVIRKIDRETRQRFKDTFEQVNTSLQTLFPKVFGGGMASLELTGEDLLDTGVAIMARPPGKKNSTIHLLSGGEKALTALALVFAIFQLNPAPFCMLDEVDAPLDDANVGRYARLVQEMSQKVQFIYITHNKIAMEMADQLLGVTMQEAGCSRLVSVDLEAAAALAEQ